MVRDTRERTSDVNTPVDRGVWKSVDEGATRRSAPDEVAGPTAVGVNFIVHVWLVGHSRCVL